MKDNYAVIMAGGIGSRFWPKSRSSYPKQFHDMLGVGQTLIQATYERFLKLCPKENILIVTNEAYKGLVLEQLAGISETQVLLEPSMRNTAPCIAYACYKIQDANPNANIVVAPSDHLILKEDSFIEIVNVAIDQANAEDCLVTLGIKPSRPDTGYGYIQFEEEFTSSELVRKVKTFTEKPNLDMAQKFLESGDFYWNSGIFVWNAKAIINAFGEHLNEVDILFKDGIGKYNTEEEQSFINTIYQHCKNISIDYGIMEKADNVFVVLSDFGWSDLGTWGSLYTHVEKDASNNSLIGENIRIYESENNMVNVPNDKLVVLQGLKDYIVVDTGDVLLVAQKQEEQNIKKIVNDLKIDGGEQFT